MITLSPLTIDATPTACDLALDAETALRTAPEPIRCDVTIRARMHVAVVSVPDISEAWLVGRLLLAAGLACSTPKDGAVVVRGYLPVIEREGL